MIKSYSISRKIGNYTGKNVCIIDSGSGVELARILSNYFLKTYYYSEWKQGGFPNVNRWVIGQFIPGIIRVENLFNIINDADLQKYLIKQGKLVWGARDGERLEQDRLFLKETLASVELPVGNYGVCYGTKELRKYLQEHNDVYVKIDKFRGTSETFHSESWDIIEPAIDEMDIRLGPVLKDKMKFIIEDSIKTEIEAGMDLYMVNGKFPERCMGGIEIKNAGYLCKILPYHEFPKQLTEINDKLSPYFKEVGYCGAFSTEIRIAEDGKNYMMDATCRQPLPPSQLQWYMYKNLADIYWETAAGNLIDCEIDEPIGCEIILTSDFAKHNWLPVSIPNEFRENVFWDRYLMDGSKTYISYDPENKYIGSVVATGMYLQDAIDKAETIAKSISGIEVMYDSDSITEALDEVTKMKKLGLNFF